MFNNLRPTHWSLLLLSLVLLLMQPACTKKAEPAPEYPIGSFDVTFSPANSIRAVQIGASGSSGSIGSGSPDATGYVKVSNLSPGNYVLTFDAATGYTAPAPQTITIADKTNTALGTVKVNTADPPNTYVPRPVQGLSGWTTTILTLANTVNTTATQATTTGNVTYYNGSPSSLRLKGIYQNGNVAETVELYVPYISASPAQYQLNYNGGAGYGTYLRTVGGATSLSLSSMVAGTQGTATITLYNTVTRTISGTYGFNLFSSSNVNNGTVTNGTFTVTY